MTTVRAGAHPQPRVPGGGPTGGQYAPRPHPEVEGSTLGSLTDEEYNRDGSFFWPPYPRSAAQLVAFFESVPVPDQVLTRVSHDYVEHVERLEDAAMDDVQARWEREHPRPQPGIFASAHKASQSSSAWEAARDAAVGAELDRVRSLRPPSIPGLWTRPLVRASLMHWYSSTLPAEEQAEVDTHVVQIGGHGYTVAELSSTYRLHELQERGSFADPRGNAREISALADALTGRLDEVRESIERLQ